VGAQSLTVAEGESLMPFKGSCHCSAVRYTVDEEPPAKAMACNCSICRCRAPLHHFTTPDKFTLETPRDAVATYKWNTGNIAFHHCKTLRRGHRPGRARNHPLRWGA